MATCFDARLPVAKKAKASPLVYPTCVRHAKARKDVRLRHYFLCDACAALWTRDAFAGSAPLYAGEQVNGYCMLCNQIVQVRMRIWFLCDICDRVANSIGRNPVAEPAIRAFWEANIKPRLPHLELIRNDIALRPRRDSDVRATAPLDFLARDTRTSMIHAPHGEQDRAVALRDFGSGSTGPG
jgi:hypothetical protein